MSNTHTPAPWKFDEATGIVYASIPDDEAGYVWEPGIAHTQSPDMECLSHETATANARLIAAAPELLEALMFIVEQVSNEKNSHHTLGAFSRGVGIDMAKKTIAKVKGE